MQFVKTLTIRNVTSSLADALEAEKRRLGTSMNNTVLQLLRESLNVDKDSGRRTNGLEKLAGGWTEEDFQVFERNTTDQRVVDDEMWK